MESDLNVGQSMVLGWKWTRMIRHTLSPPSVELSKVNCTSKEKERLRKRGSDFNLLLLGVINLTWLKSM